MKKGTLIFAACIYALFAVSILQANVARILPDKARNEAIDQLANALDHKDEDLIAQFPYVINPFFFEQPLLLKLKAPGGISDMDLLKAMGKQVLSDLSGAFVRGSKRSLLMKSGDLIREGDTLTRSLNEFGDIETTVKVIEIQRGSFVLELNKSQFNVDMTSR